VILVFFDGLDAGPVPIALVAEIVKVYVPTESPRTVQEVVVVVHEAPPGDATAV
jgi:hypothetical protein